jgi:hypothetical protein
MLVKAKRLLIYSTKTTGASNVITGYMEINTHTHVRPNENEVGVINKFRTLQDAKYF